MYRTFIKNSFWQNSIYRANTLLYTFFSAVYLLIQFSIWTALYKNENLSTQVNLMEMLTYVVLTALTGSFTNNFIGDKLADKIRTGEIVGDFIRPINLKYY